MTWLGFGLSALFWKAFRELVMDLVAALRELLCRDLAFLLTWPCTDFFLLLLRVRVILVSF